MNCREGDDAVAALVDSAAEIGYLQLPIDARERARNSLLDTLGAALAGTRHEAACAIESVTRSSGGYQQATAIGWRTKLPAGDAALVNTASARAYDFDDIHFSIGHHPSVSTVPAALAAAELSGASGRAVLAGIALGQDFGLRIRGACPLRLGEHSWVAQSYAAMEAALSAGKVIGLPAAQLRHAVGIAFCFFGGTPQTQHDGGNGHLVHHGSATRSGLMAALYAAAGITGAQNVLEGRFGLYPAYHKGQFDRAFLLARLGQHFLGVEAGFKAYPTCSLIHVAIEAALAVRKKFQLEPSDIADVRVAVNGPAYLSCARQPWYPPRSTTDAQFSIPFAVALALVHGEIRLRHMTPEALSCCPDEVVRIAPVVRPLHDRSLDGSGSQVAPSSVTVTLRDGTVCTQRAIAAKGYPERPLALDELREKFRDCVAFARYPLPEDSIGRILHLVDRLHEEPTVTPLMQVLESRSA